MRCALMLCVSLGFVTAGHAESAALDLAALDAYIADQAKSKGFVGMSVAIVKNNKIVFAKAYGSRTLKQGDGAEVDTQFAAGSISKQFACACILLLEEEGKLSIYDKVAKYYPHLTRAKDISLYDLMTHTSGYADYYPLDFIDRRMIKAISPDQLIADYAGGKLDFEPGSRWSYSNTGYVILGRIVEKVSGQAFGDFLAAHIFKPLGMDHSDFEHNKHAKNRAIGHTAFALADAEPSVQEGDGWLHAAGGIFTTPTDLAIWDLALMNGKVLKPQSYQMMTSHRHLADGRIKNYGCGLAIGQRDGETLLQHSGAVSGYLAFNAMIPGTKSAVILMTNCDHLDAAALNDDLLNRLLKSETGQSSPVPKIDGPPAKKVATELLQQLQQGDVNRKNLSEEYNLYLTEKRIASSRERLQDLGEPDNVVVEHLSERGGMEVALIRFTFKNVKMKALLYRLPDGKIQQFLLYKS